MASITIDLPDTITIPLGRNSVYGTLDVDVERLPHNALEYVWSYGLRQVINDAMATKVDKDGNALSDREVGLKAYDKLQALYAGTLRMRGEAIAADAYEAEAIREAKRHTISVFTKAGLMKNIPKGTENRMMFVINRELTAKGKSEMTESAYLANFFTTKVGEAIIERARKTVDERRELATDITDFFAD
jgi:hypothetical protein